MSDFNRRDLLKALAASAIVTPALAAGKDPIRDTADLKYLRDTAGDFHVQNTTAGVVLSVVMKGAPASRERQVFLTSLKDELQRKGLTVKNYNEGREVWVAKDDKPNKGQRGTVSFADQEGFANTAFSRAKNANTNVKPLAILDSNGEKQRVVSLLIAHPATMDKVASVYRGIAQIPAATRAPVPAPNR